MKQQKVTVTITVDDDVVLPASLHVMVERLLADLQARVRGGQDWRVHVEPDRDDYSEVLTFLDDADDTDDTDDADRDWRV